MIRWFLCFFILAGCAHKEMDIKRAVKLCRKIYGPEQELPKPLPKDLARMQEDTVKVIGDCYREYIERTRDPRDYVSCGMVTLDPKASPRLTILSTQEMLPPEIMIQCTQRRFKKIDHKPNVKKPTRMEFVFHHIAVTKG